MERWQKNTCSSGIIEQSKDDVEISSESSTKFERVTDDKNIVLMTNFVSIADIPTTSIFNHTIHSALAMSTKYRSFNKGNVKKELTECVDGIMSLSD